MKKTKFTFNSLLLIVAVFSAIILFVMVTLYDFAVRVSYEEEFPVEGTEYVIRNSNLRPDGLYRQNDLLCEGTFGYEWGAAKVGNYIYCNEYENTKLGFLTSDLVRIDLDTLEKETVSKNTLLRGKCASGELVCFEGYVDMTWFPETNSLRQLMRVADPDVQPEPQGAIVVFLDPDTGAEEYRVTDPEALTDESAEKYLSTALEEVKG